MSRPIISSLREPSPAAAAGLAVGDAILSVAGVVPRDIIDYHQLVDGTDPEFEIDRAGIALTVVVEKREGEPTGIEISDALFDRVRTCDNHCEFCFIYQLPKGLRRTLYVKDDDYRLSFLYGNFTTLTRFTEADLERVVTERLSPLYVSIHTTDPLLRAEILRNPRGAYSLRWLEVLLAEGIEVHGQIVLLPGVNDGEELVKTLTDVALRFPRLTSVGVVPLGVSRYTREPRMRATTREEAVAAIETIAAFQQAFAERFGRPVVYASDEFYLIAGAGFPSLESYGDLPQLENGVGVFRAFEAEFLGVREPEAGARSGFFASIDGAPALGYRAVRFSPRRGWPEGGRGRVKIITSTYGRLALERLAASSGVEMDFAEVENRFFGGNIAVAGLMAGEDVASAIAGEEGVRLLLPDVCLSEGRFIDGRELESLPHPVEVVPSDGRSLAQALAGRRFPAVGKAS